MIVILAIILAAFIAFPLAVLLPKWIDKNEDAEYPECIESINASQDEKERRELDEIKRRTSHLYSFLSAILNASPQQKESDALRNNLFNIRMERHGRYREVRENDAQERLEQVRAKARHELAALIKLTSFMAGYGTYNFAEVKEYPKAYRDALRSIITDGEKLQEALLALSWKNVTNGQGDPIKGVPSWGDFHENGCYDAAVFTPWMEKVEELWQVAEKLQESVKALKVAKLEKMGKEISSVNLTSTAIDFSSPMLLPTSNSLLPEEEEVIRQVQEKLGEMPAIESERAKRALSTIAEAQILRSEASKGNSLTIDGCSPEALVRSVIDGNVQLLREQVLHYGVADQLDPVDQLQVLDIYTKDKRGK